MPLCSVEFHRTAYPWRLSECSLSRLALPRRQHCGLALLRQPAASHKSPRQCTRLLAASSHERDPRAGNVVLSLQDFLGESKNYSDLTVPQLKSLLKQQGLKVSGVKKELIQRLEEAETAASDGRKTPKKPGEQAGGKPSSLPGDKQGISSRPGEVDSVAELMLKAGVGIPQSYIKSKGLAGSQAQSPSSSASSQPKDAAANGMGAVETVSSNQENSGRRASGLPAQDVGELPWGPRRSGSPKSLDTQHRSSGPVSQEAQDPPRPRSAGRIPSRRGRGSHHVHQGKLGRNSGGRPRGGRGRGRTGEIGLDSDPAHGDQLVKPRVPGLVLVEGANDISAVRRAVVARNIVAIKDVTAQFGEGKKFRQVLKEMGAGYDKVFVAMDPDNAGQSYRLAISQQIPRAFHVFIPVNKCIAKTGTKHHQAGNVGLEHAAPFDIQAALLRARVAKPERKEFTLQEMEEWGIAGRHGEVRGDSKWAAYGGVRTRRRLLSEALGLHDGSSKSLLRNMNYFFLRKEVEDALAGLPGPGEPIPDKLTDGIADSSDGPGASASSGDENDAWPAAFPMYPMKD